MKKENDKTILLFTVCVLIPGITLIVYLLIWLT